MMLRLRQLPRGVIFCIDVIIAIGSILFSYLLRFNFAIPASDLHSLSIVIPLAVVIRIIFSLWFKTYAGIILYTSTEDAQRIFIASTFGSLSYCLINFGTHFWHQFYIIPFSIVIIDWIVCVFFLIAFRMMVKIIYLEIANTKKHKINAVIYGSGDSAVLIKRTMDQDSKNDFNLIAFVDDSPSKQNMKMEGVSIIPSTKLDQVLSEDDVDQLFIADSKISNDRKKQIIETCLKYSTKVLHLPPASKWINGELSINQIKQVKIEELLERDPIQLDEDKISAQLSGKRVLITGAAGSIGSELARQILRFKPAKLFLLDQAETPLYELEIELAEKYDGTQYETVLGDVRVYERMEKVFKVFKPEMVFHAAAYKHVPLMEANPSESILTNVLGSKIVADLSVKYGVKKMVMVSTDKAVNPTGVMGASKRIAEIYVQALDKKSAAEQKTTRFITTRFGNVLGSNGSVIPLFRKQIEDGGPVTVTHPEITRFFMTIPEACQLVLEAGAIGNGGEIMIFDMGESVKIVELAKKMIRLSGLELGKDIQINFTGLRPGEKLYEELLNNNENTQPTHHEKIMIASVREYEYDVVEQHIDELVKLFDTQNNLNIVRKMKEIVPEYTSNNSIYEELDKEERTLTH